MNNKNFVKYKRKVVQLLESVLIISANEQSIISFSQLLKAYGYQIIDSTKSGADSRRHISDRGEYDLVIINAPLTDEYGDLLANDIAQNTNSGVVLTVKSEVEFEIESRTSEYGVFVLAKPLSKQLFYKAIKLLEASRNRINGVKKENIKLQKKIDDIRIINRAKCILMEYLSMSEPQAHKYLERQAMDLRLTKVEVAKRLLTTYES